MNLHQSDRRFVAVFVFSVCAVVFTLMFGPASAQQGDLDDSLPGTPSVPIANIVGGQNADPGEYGYQVVVYAGPFMCGGSLIDKEWVLTAAHCLFDESDNAIPVSQISVVAGEHNIVREDGNEQNFDVKAAITNPKYDGFTADGDVALLQLNGAVNLNASNVSTISLLAQKETPAGKNATVTGWGALSEGGDGPDVLQEVVVPIVSDQACNAAYFNEITGNMFCAGYKQGGKDSCQGDSGGPLVISDGNGGWIQAGVVSWGSGCANPDLYGVYARVANYISWLEQTTGLSFRSTPTPAPTPIPSDFQNVLYFPFIAR